MNPLRLAVLVFAVLSPSLALAQVSVSEPWVRGTVPGQHATGAFMKLLAADDSALVAVASPVAKTVEVHEMAMEGNVMKMRAVDRIALPKGKTVELKPGGYHVMLMGLERTVKAGEEVPLTLTFEDRAGKRSSVEVKAKTRPLTGSGSQTKH
jgi:copper(I)-binding protein